MSALAGPGHQDAEGHVLPTDRGFGLLFTVVFLVAGTYFWLASARVALAATLAAVSLVLLAVTWLSPARLRPLNRAWFAFGQMLGRIVTPLVLGLLYFVVITPVAVATRAFGRDELRLRWRDRSRETHWVQRTPPGPPPDSFTRQF